MSNVFTYFEDKQQLFFASVAESLEEFSEQILDFNPEAADPIDELEKTITAHVSLFSRFQNSLTCCSYHEQAK